MWCGKKLNEKSISVCLPGLKESMRQAELNNWSLDPAQMADLCSSINQFFTATGVIPPQGAIHPQPQAQHQTPPGAPQHPAQPQGGMHPKASQHNQHGQHNQHNQHISTGQYIVVVILHIFYCMCHTLDSQVHRNKHIFHFKSFTEVKGHHSIKIEKYSQHLFFSFWV